MLNDWTTSRCYGHNRMTDRQRHSILPSIPSKFKRLRLMAITAFISSIADFGGLEDRALDSSKASLSIWDLLWLCNAHSAASGD